MAASEDQPQPVVFYILTLRLYSTGEASVELLGKLPKRRIEPGAPAHTVNRFEAASGNQPRSGIHRDAITRPLLHRRGEGIVQRLLGEVEVVEQTDKSREDATRVGAVDSAHNLARPLGGVFGHKLRVRVHSHSQLHSMVSCKVFARDLAQQRSTDWRSLRYWWSDALTFPCAHNSFTETSHQ